MGIKIAVSLSNIKVNSPSQVQKGPGQKLEVEVTGYQRVYVFSLNSRLIPHINDIETIVPILETIVADLCKQGKMTTSMGKLYYHPLFITVNQPDHPTQFLTVAGSARALANLLEDSRTGKLPPLQGTLITHDRTKNYEYAGLAALWDGGGLEWLSSLYPKIQPSHVGFLATMQLSITPRGRNVIWTLNGLLRQGCLSSLKNLFLQFSAASQPVIHHKGWLCIGLQRNEDDYFGDNFMEQSYLSGTYSLLSRDKEEYTPPKLERLLLVLWADLTKTALAAVSSQYQTLKALIIDDVMSTMKTESKLDYVSYHNYTRSYDMGTYKAERTITSGIEHDVYTLVPNDDPELPTLDQIVEKFQDNNQLEELQIYEWGVKGQAPKFDWRKLSTYIQNGWLPHLNSIVMRSHSDYVKEDNTPINPETAMNTTDLLGALLDKKVPIEKLDLRMPEIMGYQPWLEAIKLGKFSQLKELYYLVPTPYEGETNQDHEDRIKMALEAIKEAIVTKQIPQLKCVAITGIIPNKLLQLAQEIENLIHTQETTVLPSPSSSAHQSAPMPSENEDLKDLVVAE